MPLLNRTVTDQTGKHGAERGEWVAGDTVASVEKLPTRLSTPTLLKCPSDESSGSHTNQNIQVPPSH